MVKIILPTGDYETFRAVEGGIPLAEIFPNGIEVEISGEGVELLTAPAYPLAKHFLPPNMFDESPIIQASQALLREREGK